MKEKKVVTRYESSYGRTLILPKKEEHYYIILKSLKGIDPDKIEWETMGKLHTIDTNEEFDYLVERLKELTSLRKQNENR